MEFKSEVSSAIKGGNMGLGQVRILMGVAVNCHVKLNSIVQAGSLNDHSSDQQSVGGARSTDKLMS